MSGVGLLHFLRPPPIHDRKKHITSDKCGNRLIFIKLVTSLCNGKSRLVAATKYVYIQSTTVYVPSSELGLSHPPLSPVSVPLPPKQRGEGALASGRGVGESQFRRLEKRLSTLPSLWLLLLSHKACFQPIGRERQGV
jgi:hypothetical protein